MNLVTGAFSSHPSSWISWTMRLGVKWWLSKHGAAKHYRHASSLEQGLWKEQFPELPCQLVDTCYCQKQPQLWLWGGCGGRSASWLWVPISTPLQIKGFQSLCTFTSLQSELVGAYLYHLLRLEIEKTNECSVSSPGKDYLLYFKLYNDEKCLFKTILGQLWFLIHKYFSTFTMKTMTYYI